MKYFREFYTFHVAKAAVKLLLYILTDHLS